MVTPLDLMSNVMVCLSTFSMIVPLAPIFAVIVRSGFILMRIGPSTSSTCRSPGASGELGSNACGTVAASFILTPLLPTTSPSTLCSSCAWCATSLNRSASNACNMAGTSSLVAPSGIVATISKRSCDIHGGPLI